MSMTAAQPAPKPAQVPNLNIREDIDLSDRYKTILRKFTDVSLINLHLARVALANIEQVDRVSEGQSIHKDDLKLLSYMQMRELSSSLRRDPDVHQYMKRIEQRAAQEARMTHPQFMARPSAEGACERVSLTIAGREKFRAMAVATVKTMIGSTNKVEAFMELVQAVNTKPTPEAANDRRQEARPAPAPAYQPPRPSFQ